MLAATVACDRGAGPLVLGDAGGGAQNDGAPAGHDTAVLDRRDTARELTPVETCNQFQSIFCDKIFGCLTPDEANLAKAVIGLDAADCKVKFGSECTVDKAQCDPGKVFKPGNGQACLDRLRTLSCKDIRDDPSTTPAICEQVCQ